MSDVNSFIRRVVGSILQLDAKGAGPQWKNESGASAFRNSTDTAYAVVRGATPVADNDLVTKQYAATMLLVQTYVVTAQFDGANPLPANTGSAHYLVVTTTGVNAAIGDLLWDDGSGADTVTLMTAAEGRLIFTSAAFSGGTVALDANTIYAWDAGTSSWLEEASGKGVSGALRTIEVPYSSAAATFDSVHSIPANAIIYKAMADQQVVMDNAAGVAIGIPTNAALFQGTTDNVTSEVALSIKEQRTSVGVAAAKVRVTITNAPTVGSGVAVVFYSLPND